MNYYPVIIPTLNRYDHFRNCVESLSHCKYADQTELIIGLDYPSKETHFDGYKRIKDYIPKITGFKKVTVLERCVNFGAVKNLEELEKYAFNHFDGLILTEDDNVFASTFLEYINSALETYKDCDNIGSVCGYILPNQYNRESDVLLSYDASAWGAGYWKNKNTGKFSVSKKVADNIIHSFRKSLKLGITYPACLSMLLDMTKKNKYYADVVRTSSNIVSMTYQLKPSISLVRNMGHDGSGLHCSSDAYMYVNQALSKRNEYIVNDNSVVSRIPKEQLFRQGLNCNKVKALIFSLQIILKYILFRIKQ